MTTDEFAIDPRTVKPKRPVILNRRPLPPGQTRHLYDGEEDRQYDYDDDPVSVADARQNSNPDNVDDDFSDEDLEYNPRASKRNIARQKRNEKKNAPKKKEVETPKQSSGLVDFFFDPRTVFFTGVFCLLLGAIILVWLLSYLKSGYLDQAVIMNVAPEEIVSQGYQLDSKVGSFGAWLGHVLFAESFGIGAFVAAIYFLKIGFNLLIKKKFSFWGLTFRCVLLMISISIVVGLVTYAVGSKTFWGGVHGHYVNKWLLEMTGVPGAILVSVLLVAALAAVYLNEITRYYRKWKKRINLKSTVRHIREVLPEDETDSGEEFAVDGESESTTFADNDRQDNPFTENERQENPFADNRPARENGNAPNGDIEFEIDSPRHFAAGASHPGHSAATDETSHCNNAVPGTDDNPKEPTFEIDVAVAERGKKSGSVAEKLVAEQGEYNPRAELSRFKFPTLDLLADIPVKTTVDTQEQQANKERIIKTLGNYGITIDSIKATVGPTVTLYEIIPTEGIRIAQIKRLEDDIALSLAAKGIRIIAPMPGKGTVGIEVPNNDPQVVSMRSIMASKRFRESKAKLPIALGATIANEVFVTDLAAMPHALVAGATGQGKSVGLNVLISSLLYRKHPSELKFVLIDPKMVEFSVYERLRRHYLASLPGEEDAIVTDPGKVLGVLNSLCLEMDNRYSLLRKAAVNKIEDYNAKFCQRRLSMEKGHRYLPYIVVIIDEFADLIMTGGKDIENPVMRITQKARAVGIHMIIATQRPSTNVLTGIIKANCPSRIAFRVLQNVDSRTILDRPGAERLIGKGDMLYSQGGDLERMQCAFISSAEIEAICDSIENQPGYEEPYPLPEPESATVASGGGGSLPAGGLDRDPLFDEAARFVIRSSTASTSSLQRRFEIGYNRAGKIMDQMEAIGIVGPASGAKPRAVLVDEDTLERILANR